MDPSHRTPRSLDLPDAAALRTGGGALPLSGAGLVLQGGGRVGTTLLGDPELGPGRRPTGTSPEIESCVAHEFSPVCSLVVARDTFAAALSLGPLRLFRARSPYLPRARRRR